MAIGKKLEPQTGFTTTKGIQLPPEPGWRRWLWWSLGAIAAMVIVLVGVRVWRRKPLASQP